MGERIRTSDILKILLIAALLAVTVRVFFFEPAYVLGDSMQPSLHDKDRLLISKMTEPQRFDIIVFRTEEMHELVKRVIGLPGDEIEYKNDMLYVNGKSYHEPYLEEIRTEIDDGRPLTNTFTLETTRVGDSVVPEGELFVMGDNRRDSMDSRYIGTVPIDDVIGVTKMIFYPFHDMKIMKGKDYREDAQLK